MSLLITGNKSKITNNEIKNISLDKIIGITTSFETYLDPLQQNNIS
jgi:hypothetical protein